MSAPIISQILIGFPLFALLFASLERWYPLRRQRLLRAGWAVDVCYYVLGCIVGHFSSVISLAAMLLIRHKTGWTFGVAAVQPAWLQFLEILVASDFLGYVFHRALHSYAWLWRFHQVHHSSEHMDWLANARLHPVDKLLGDAVQFTPLLLLGFESGPLFAYTVVLGLQAFLNHANVRFDFGLLHWVIASPRFHHWHHCNNPRAYNRNFAPHLVIFDILFGTADIPAGSTKPWKYGLPEKVPEGFWRQMIYPFRRGTPTTTRSRCPERKFQSDP